MWFSLFALVLILAIAFYDGLQGLFTGMINCILAILAAALAFGLYEDLYVAALRDHQPNHGRAIALLAIFILTLLILRALFDALIKGNLQFPRYVDRAGGGIFGFITGMIVVGMLSIGFEMLPFGDSVLGFSRLTLVDRETNQPVPEEEIAKRDPATLRYVQNGTWLDADSFTVALVSHLSSNALAGRTRFADVYPDFLNGAYRARARLTDERVTPDLKVSMDVEGYWDLRTNELFARKREKDSKKVTLVAHKDAPQPGHKRIVVRAAFREAGKEFELTPGQVRLVVCDKDRGCTEHLLVGINEEKAGHRLVLLYDGELLERSLGGNKNKMDLVFEVPEGASFGEGSFLELKQNVRAEIRPSHDKNKTRPGPLSEQRRTGTGGNRPTTPNSDDGAGNSDNGAGGGNTSSSGGNTSTPPPQGQDRVSGIGPARKDSVFSDRLPFTLTSYTGNNLEAGSGEIKGGHLIAPLAANWQPAPGGSNPPLERLEVPQDKRLLQLSVEKLQPGSWIGQIYGGAIDRVADFYLVDANGEKYMPSGMYAMANVNGRPTFELIFLDEQARGMSRVPRLDRIKPTNLQGDYAFYFLFHVPPGTRATKFHTGRRDVDLEALNLVAPQ